REWIPANRGRDRSRPTIAVTGHRTPKRGAPLQFLGASDIKLTLCKTSSAPISQKLYESFRSPSHCHRLRSRVFTGLGESSAGGFSFQKRQHLHRQRQATDGGSRRRQGRSHYFCRLKS